MNLDLIAIVNAPALAILIPLVVGLVQIIKNIGLSERWAPVPAVILGILAAFLTSGVTAGATILGLVIGLAACGLWSSPKALAGK